MVELADPQTALNARKGRWALEDPDHKLRPGDMCHFPQLLSGAGECEGLFFVWHGGRDGEHHLLRSDVESPTFPREIADQCTPQELRERYEAALELALAEQKMDLRILFGGAQEEFWARPDISREPKAVDSDAAADPSLRILAGTFKMSTPAQINARAGAPRSEASPRAAGAGV